jgi:Mn2+/Fe2+ NRAMP family transporter
LIVAGSIVGSGELIATTKAGAEAGFALLWLIVLGCVVKVFTQVELGRYALISGRTTLSALAEVPGPRVRGRGNWLVWYWFVMWFASISQLGGIAGGVGQALAISIPVTQLGSDYNELADARVKEQIQQTLSRRRETTDRGGEVTVPGLQTRRDAEQLQQEFTEKYTVTVDGLKRVRSPADVVIWASLVAAVTSVLLVVGRYSLIQRFSTALVSSFTLLVICNLLILQRNPDFGFSAAEFFSGFTFSTTEPGAVPDGRAVRTALAAFGIIGVGAAELVTYPYWCLERGYARFTGPNDHSPQWVERARGWMRVMRFDAWGAMLVYTFSTVAFYLLGASVLHRVGLNPEKSDMVRTLAVMFVPVFSDWAATVFLFGAFAVLYSTFFVAIAAHARVFADGMRVIGLIDDDDATRQRWVTRLSGFFPVLCVIIFVIFPSPARLVLLSGVAQGIMLPMLAAAALYFRYRRAVPGLTPGSWWDAFLWLSAAAMLWTGLWTIYSEVSGYFGPAS